MENKLTVSQLIKDLQHLEAQGFGKHLILITSDDEGNNYHECFYTASAIDDETLEYIQDITDQTTQPINAQNYIMLG